LAFGSTVAGHKTMSFTATAPVSAGSVQAGDKSRLIPSPKLIESNPAAVTEYRYKQGEPLLRAQEDFSGTNYAPDDHVSTMWKWY
jgi:hypothetical protein